MNHVYIFREVVICYCKRCDNHTAMAREFAVGPGRTPGAPRAIWMWQTYCLECGALGATTWASEESVDGKLITEETVTPRNPEPF